MYAHTSVLPLTTLCSSLLLIYISSLCSCVKQNAPEFLYALHIQSVQVIEKYKHKSWMEDQIVKQTRAGKAGCENESRMRLPARIKFISTVTRNHNCLTHV